MTSQTITINSDYFQVTPEGKVTCQALSITGEKSFINLNDIFIVTPDGKVTIVDDGNPYNGRNSINIYLPGQFGNNRNDLNLLSNRSHLSLHKGSSNNSLGSGGGNSFRDL